MTDQRQFQAWTSWQRREKDHCEWGRGTGINPSSHLNPFLMSDYSLIWTVSGGFVLNSIHYLTKDKDVPAARASCPFTGTQTLSDSSHHSWRYFELQWRKAGKIQWILPSTNMLMTSVCILWVLSCTTYLWTVSQGFWIDNNEEIHGLSCQMNKWPQLSRFI